MSYTTAAEVRHNLVTPFAVSTQIENQSLIITGSDYLKFYGNSVSKGTVRVKTIISHDQTLIAITIITGTTSISSLPVVPGSVVVATDSSLGKIYTENLDYTIDYAKGTLSTRSGGALVGGEKIAIWYLPFFLYTEGADYVLKNEKGEIRKLSGGAIADGENLFLDYNPEFLVFDDELINSAVATANALVEREIDPSAQIVSDLTLNAIATYRAMEIISRASASRELASLRGEDKIAIAWLKLADDYYRKSELMMQTFRPAANSLRAPKQG